MSTTTAVAPKRLKSRVRFRDAIAIGTFGLTNRRGRTILTALGIAIGIASMVAVLGISASSKADLISRIDKLGTNLLRVEAGQSFMGESSQLPPESPAMARRIGPVQNASSIAKLQAKVYRTAEYRVDNGAEVIATEPQLISTLEAHMAQGRFLQAGAGDLPNVVLGSVAAERLGLTSLSGAPTVSIAGRQFAVSGIMQEMELHPDLNRAVFISVAAAESHLNVKVVPTAVFARTTPDQVDAVRSVLAQTVNPTAPNEAKVSRPSDALEARAQVDQNLQTLLLGLGGVSMLVGGVGIANVMIISVLERRGEIGLRRALGATRSHIASQFVMESAALSLLGGILGALIGVGVTYGYASQQGWAFSVPIAGLVGGTAVSLLIGAIAGLYPAIQASRLDPAEAVRPVG